MPDDLLHFHEEWDAKLKDAFKQFNAVDQPLAWLIESQYRDKVKAIAAGEAEMDSILGCYYDPEKHI
jgi:hypothetical protein